MAVVFCLPTKSSARLLQKTYGDRLPILLNRRTLRASVLKRFFQNLLAFLSCARSALWLVALSPAYAAKVSDVSSTTLREQALRFFTFQDPSLRYALAGVILLGVTCGLLGSFIVVRKMALVGDTLSHAVLPGVALGFLWHQTKDLSHLCGANMQGLSARPSLVGAKNPRLKRCQLLAFAPSFFRNLIVWSHIQRLPTGNKTGIAISLWSAQH